MNGLGKIRGWLTERSLNGILLNRRDNYAWIAGSDKRNHVLQNTETGVATLLITNDYIDLIADTIDGSRLEEEEVDLPVHLVQYPWHYDGNAFLKHFIAGRNVVSDTGVLGTANVQPDLVELRLDLDPGEQDQYRIIGQQCATLVETICRAAQPGMTERQVASELQSRCLKNGINPNCVLVGSDDRIFRYRHPMPTDKTIDKCLMVVLGGEKNGLNISLTRFVFFEQPSAEYMTKFRKTQMIFAQMQSMTADGMTYKEFFDNVKKLYVQAGYPDEWQLHHQGGPTGYACREKIITPSSEGQIQKNQAFAWNPTITGTKCEETTLLTATGIEILTRTSNWPVTEISTSNGNFSVADILILS